MMNIMLMLMTDDCEDYNHGDNSKHEDDDNDDNHDDDGDHDVGYDSDHNMIYHNHDEDEHVVTMTTG